MSDNEFEGPDPTPEEEEQEVLQRRRPLIEMATENEFGDFEAQALANDTPLDVTYVPGYSDLRHKRDVEVAEAVHLNRDPKTVSKLPVYVRWTRAFDPKKNESDGRKLFLAEQRGLRKATKQDIGKPWLTALPPGAKVAADGSIVQGDTVLMVAEAETAARNRARQRKMTEQTLDAIGSEVISSAQRVGSEAEVTKSVGRPVKVGRRKKG